MLLVLTINSAGRGRRVCDKHRLTGQTQTDDEIMTVDMIWLVLRMQRKPVHNINGINTESYT
jgi:hypothetical protein